MDELVRETVESCAYNMSVHQRVDRGEVRSAIRSGLLSMSQALREEARDGRDGSYR